MKCKICGDDIYLQCNDDDPYKISDEPVCRRCYFDELGKVVEKHPIGIPVLRRI